MQEGSVYEEILEKESDESDDEAEELPPPALIDANLSWSCLETALRVMTPSSWNKIDVKARCVGSLHQYDQSYMWRRTEEQVVVAVEVLLR